MGRIYMLRVVDCRSIKYRKKIELRQMLNRSQEWSGIINTGWTEGAIDRLILETYEWSDDEIKIVGEHNDHLRIDVATAAY